jgi:hypothetical protein
MTSQVDNDSKALVVEQGRAISSEESVEEEGRAEHALFVDCVRDVAITVPLTIALWVGLVALAVRHQDPDWGAWLAMAVGIGTLAGIFFGVWIAFVRNAPLLQKIDTRVVNDAHRLDLRGRQSQRQSSRTAA